MKVLITVIALLIGNYAYAQVNTAQTTQDSDTQRVPTPGLDRYTGTWRYTNGSEIFEVKLWLATGSITSGGKTFDIDWIEGSHLYKRDGKIIEQSGDKGLSSIYLGRAKYFTKRDDNFIDFNFRNPLGSLIAKGSLKYRPGTTPALVWFLGALMSFSPDQNTRPSHKIPTNAILLKVK